MLFDHTYASFASTGINPDTLGQHTLSTDLITKKHLTLHPLICALSIKLEQKLSRTHTRARAHAHAHAHAHARTHAHAHTHAHTHTRNPPIPGTSPREEARRTSKREKLGLRGKPAQTEHTCMQVTHTRTELGVVHAGNTHAHRAWRGACR